MMNMGVWIKGLLASVLSVSLATSTMACTTLSYTDANGNMYVGRTNEYPGTLPDEMTYFPAGSTIESVTPEGRKGHAFQTKFAIIGVTLKGMVPNAKQDTVHEAINDQGLSISVLEYPLNGEMKTTGPDDKILSALDFATWALGNFRTVDEIRQGIDKDGIQIWLPRIPGMADMIAPLHFAIWDRRGHGAVIEFTEGKLNFYENTTGAMTNNPPFPWHLTNLANYAGLTNVDKNSATFNKMIVSAPDAGGALRSLPASNMSADRFIKAVYYSNFAKKADTSEVAILTLSHIMNNFDRPDGITIDDPGTLGSESIPSKTPTSEMTYYTALRDLSQNHFYLRPITKMNFVRFDMAKLTGVKSVKVVSFDELNKHTDIDGSELFLK